MIYSNKISKILSKCHENFVLDKNIKDKDIDNIFIYFVDNTNKYKIFKIYLQRFDIKGLIQTFPIILIILNILNLLIILIHFLITFHLLQTNYISEFQAILIYIPIFIINYYLIIKLNTIKLYYAYYMNVSDNPIEGYDGKLKDNIIKIRLTEYKNNQIKDLIFTLYHELYHYYEHLNSLEHNEDNADNYADYMIQKYH